MLSESAAALLFLAGLALIVAGLALWSTWVGLIAAGLGVCLLSILWNRGEEPKK